MTPATSPTDPLQVVKECMAERGWEVEISDGGIASGLVPDAQKEQYEKASEEYWALAPKGGSFDETPEQDRRKYYDFYVQTRECLVNGGVALPAAPSYQAWTESKGAWRPYDDVPEDQIFEVYMKFKDLCPEVPPWAG